MSSPNKALRKWLDEATPAQRKSLAKEAKTSVPQLYHIASGRRKASAALAQRIAHASGWGRVLAPSFAPKPIDQRELCDACGKCPLLATR
jgi:hypothetical protein